MVFFDTPTCGFVHLGGTCCMKLFIVKTEVPGSFDTLLLIYKLHGVRLRNMFIILPALTNSKLTQGITVINPLMSSSNHLKLPCI
jgi:hypothetical protein